MQTEPITRALQTLDKAGVGEEQRMATVKAIAEMQQPLLEAIGKLETSINNLRVDLVKRDVRLARRDTWLIVTGAALAISSLGLFIRLVVNVG